jgi:hypothetical protein
MSQPFDEPTASDAEHVVYEIRCLRYGLRAMRRIEDPQLNNLVSEAVLVHVRNLIEFFYAGGRRHEDSLYASDFVAWRPSLDPNLDAFAGGRTVRKYRERLHQRLAHLSKARKTEPAVGGSWSLDEVSAALERDLRLFLVTLPQEKSGWFRSATLTEGLPSNDGQAT